MKHGRSLPSNAATPPWKIFNYAHAHKLIFEYIETFYNTVRIHSHCGYLSPNEYEEQYLKNIEENAVKIAS